MDDTSDLPMTLRIPSTLSLACNRIASLSTNSFKITPTTGNGSVGPGQQIRLLLPTAGLIHLPSTKLYFSVTTPASGGNNKGVRLPKYTSSLFQRVEVLCGGVTISPGNPIHNVVESLKHVINDHEGDKGSEHSEMVTGLDYLGKNFDTPATGAGATVANESYEGAGAGGGVFSVDLGDFFQSMKPNYIDLSLTGQIEVVLTIADKNVLSVVKGTELVGGTDAMTIDGTAASIAASNFTIVNPVGVVNMVSMLDGAYPMALLQRIADKGFIQYHFHEHITFQQSFNGNSRFNLAAMSLNKLHTIFRLNDALTQGGAINVAGSGTAAGKSASAVGYPWQGANTKCTSEAGGAGTDRLRGGEVRFQGKYQQFKVPQTAPVQNAANIADGTSYDYSASAPTELQYRINSTQVPNLFLTPIQAYEAFKYANGIKEVKCIKSFVEYLYNKFVLSYRFDLVTNEYDPPTISGLDSRNANSMIEVVSNGSNVSSIMSSIIVADITKLVRVGEGKQVETIA